MLFITLIFLIFFFSFFILRNILHFPLTEDEGNHYYIPQFHDRGARSHISYDTNGEFNIPFFSFLFTRLVKKKSPRTYQTFKICMLAASSAATLTLALTMTGSPLVALLAGFLMTATCHVRANKFWATYGEYLQNTFFSLGLTCTYLALSTPDPAWSLGTGLCLGLAVHAKPTAWLAAATIPLPLLFSSEWLLHNVFFFAAFLTIMALPYIWLHNKPALWNTFFKSAWNQYVKYTITGMIKSGILQVLYITGIKKFKKTHTLQYSEKNLKNAANNRVTLLRVNITDPFTKLWLVIFCGSLQTIWGIAHFDLNSILLICYVVCMLLTQHIQQNYYTPHFNIIWPPLCILAAMFMHSVLQSGMDTPGSWLMCGLVMIFVGQRIHEAWTLRNDHVPWNRYLEAACIGKALHPLVQRTDVLLAMGVFPSINIYADCPGIPTHLFGCMDGEICHKDILVRRLREYPPQWITFYTPTAPCPWDIRHIMEVGGQVYTPHPVSILPEDAAELARYKSGLRQFMAYRLNDRLCAINQCELGREALARGETSRARELFTAAASALPEEMALRLHLLDLTPDGVHAADAIDSTDTPDAADAAIAYLHTARTHSPVTANFLLVEAFVQRGALPLARKYLSDLTTQGMQSYADDPRLHVLRAQSRADMPAEAGNRLEMLAHALKLHPFHVPTLRAAITVLDAAGQLQNAAALLQSLLQLRPDDAQAKQWNISLHPQQKTHD